LSRYASVLALEGQGQAALALATGREPGVAPFGRVHFVAVAPPGEEPHAEARPRADESDGSARFGLAGLQRLHVVGAQERDAVADRREVVDEGARRNADLGGEGRP